MSSARRRASVLAAVLLLTLAAAGAIAANVALLDQGTSPGAPVGRLSRELGQTRPAAPPPNASLPQTPRTTATIVPQPTGTVEEREHEEPEGWDDDD